MSSAALAACHPGTAGTLQPPPPEMRFEQVRFAVYREATPTADGEAASVVYRRDTGSLAAEAVAVSFPDARGGEPPRLVAPRASGNTRTRSFLAEGGLRLRQGQDQAVTEAARYDPGDRLVHGDRPVTITGPGWTLAGPGFVLDPATRRMEVGEGVRLDVAGATQGSLP